MVRLPARVAGLLGAGQIPTNDPEAAGRAIADWEAALDEQQRPTPMVRRVEERVLEALSLEPLFAGPIAQDVGAVVSTTIRYVAHRLGAPKPFMRADFDGDNVIEQDLADDFEDWLHGVPLSRGSVTIEVRRIGGGRADVLIAFGTHRVVVELKRELADASRDALETHYGAQAASYQATDYPFGVVLVLDLTQEQSGTAAHLEDLVWVSNARVEGRDRWLVWCVVPGRRVTPSQLSR